MVPVLVLTGLAIQWYAQNSVATLGAMGLLLFSLWRFFLPVRYDIDGSGITQSVLRRRTHIPWHAFDRCDIRKSGLQLHRTHAVAPIDALGSYFLPFGSHRGEILPLALQWMQYAHRSHHRRETRW